MTEKDLDTAIEMCERIMEFDTRTMKDPESENGWIFEKVYDLLKFLRQLQFATDTNVDLIDRQAALNALEKVADMFPWRVPGNRDTYDRYNEAWNDAIGRAEMEIENMPSAQPGEDMRAMCGECDAWNQYKNYPQPGWIPCKTALPKEDGEYLVTIHWKNCGYYTDLFIYKAYLKEWKNEDRIFGTVIAWQPKPKPWEGEGHE